MRVHFPFAPVAEQTTGIRLLNGTTQVQSLPGAVTYYSPVMSKQHTRLLSGAVVVQVHAGEPFCKRSASCMPLVRQSLVLRQFHETHAVSPSIAQKQSNRPITGRPGSVTLWKDHL